MNKIIDIEYLAELYGIDLKKVAMCLYPDNDYPMAALKRTINETDGNLKANQIIDLAELFGCRPGDLFSVKRGWYMETNEGLHILNRGDVRITHNMESGTSIIKREGYEELAVNMHTAQVTLSEYLTGIEDIIASHLGEEE